MDSVHYLSSRLDDPRVDTILEDEGSPRQGGQAGGGWASFPVPLTGRPSAAVAENVLVVSNGRDGLLGRWLDPLDIECVRIHRLSRE